MKKEGIMQFETIILEKKDGAAKIILNRPEVLNAFNPKMSDELKKAVKDIEADKAIRVIVITGAGKAFMSGADIDKTIMAWVELAKKGGKVKDDQEKYFSPTMLEDLPQPVIAAVNGYAFGMGCEIALSCDLRIVSENARFGQPEINLGIITGGGGSVRLTRLIGKTKAMEMMLTGDPLDAQEAYRIGLVNQVVPPDKLEEAVNRLVEKLKSKGATALKSYKSSVNKAMEVGVREAIENEANLFSDIFKTEDAHEGVSAFLEKRKPQFRRR